MAYNGAGVFNIDTAGQPVVDGTLIDATVFNNLTSDLATGLSTAITKDGQTTVTANIPMAGFKVTGLGIGTASTDAARVDNANARSICEMRLTLTTATPVTTGDVTGATTVYATPYKGNRVALFDGTNWRMMSVSELSAAVPSTADVLFDVFISYNSGTPALVFSQQWASDTTRTNALTTQDGVLILSGGTYARYIGTIRTGSVAGQTEDSLAKRWVWNYYNRVRRPMRVLEGTNSWNYTTATIRQANASTANQLDFVIGISEDMVSAEIRALVSNSGAACNVGVGIGVDSTSAFTSGGLFGRTLLGTATSFFAVHASVKAFIGIGRHYLSWNEYSDASGTTTWYGDNGDPTNAQSGIHGEIWA